MPVFSDTLNIFVQKSLTISNEITQDIGQIWTNAFSYVKTKMLLTSIYYLL